LHTQSILYIKLENHKKKKEASKLLALILGLSMYDLKGIWECGSDYFLKYFSLENALK
jgi:hypothetical protein